jgi:hypothetical protein
VPATPADVKPPKKGGKGQRFLASVCGDNGCGDEAAAIFGLFKKPKGANDSEGEA